MNYFVVWTLKRGSLEEPEPVGILTKRDIEREVFEASIERDPPLSVEQMWFEQGRSAGFLKRRNVAKVPKRRYAA